VHWARAFHAVVDNLLSLAARLMSKPSARLFRHGARCGLTVSRRRPIFWPARSVPFISDFVVSLSRSLTPFNVYSERAPPVEKI